MPIQEQDPDDSSRELAQLRQRLAAVEQSLADAKVALVSSRVEADAREAFLRNVIDTVPGFVVVKSLGGRFALANRAMAEAYGTTTAEIVGKSDYDFNPNRDEVDGFVKADAEVIERRLTKHIPAERFTGRDGRGRWLQTVKVPLVEGDGSCSSLLAVALDITVQRQLELELHQAQKQHAVGQLAGGIAHDFNNLLTCMMGALCAVRAKLPECPSSVDEELSVIEDGARSGARLTRELLAFARRAPLQTSVVDMTTLIRQVAGLLRRTLDKAVRIEERLIAEPLLVAADVTHVQNALLNLAMNARDAMPEGGVLTFQTAYRDATEVDLPDSRLNAAPARFVVITVADTGVGMDASTASHVFEPFFTTKASGSGTGLGLSSAYGTARSHGGTLRFDTVLGQGSQFHLILPALPAGSECAHVDVPLRPPSTGSISTHPGKPEPPAP